MRIFKLRKDLKIVMTISLDAKNLKNDPILRSFTANGRTDERIGGRTNRAKLIENFR